MATSLFYSSASGQRGANWFFGAGDPPESIQGAEQDDIYMDTDSGSIWELQGSGWVLVADVQGSRGAAGTITVGTVASSPAGSTLTITNSGTFSDAILNFTIPRGFTGLQGIQGVTGLGTIGATGPIGLAATVALGSVGSGSTGMISNSGTLQAAIFDFILPRGFTGVQGVTGIQGLQGSTGIQGLTGAIGATGAQATFSYLATTPSRTVGTAFQPNATKGTYCTYTFLISCSLSLTGGQEGKVDLLSDTSNPPTTLRDTISQSNTGTLTIGLALTQANKFSLSYIVPPAHYVKLVSTNVTGSPTITLISQAEVTIG